MRHPFHHRHCDEAREGFFMIGRHRGGRGFGPMGGFMGGGQEFRTGRKLGSTDLQLLILALLADKPSHGYELIKALEERSGGFYVPSPGMVYPALTFLEEIGHATVEAAGAKKLYSITEEGRTHLEQNRANVDALLAQLAQIGERMESVRKAFAGAEGEEGEGDEREFKGRGFREILMARRALKAALHEKKRSSPEEYRRIAEILLRAAAEIQGQ
jgi:DNA-binding PadR family transcriptional regulator